MAFVIGVTGGIAAGKSTLIQHFKLHQIDSIDCDVLGHKTYVPGTEAYKALIATFDGITKDDGTINRPALGKQVFGNKEQLKKLTDITWPAIKQLAKDEIDSKSTCKVVVVEAAILIEAGWQDLVNEVWVISTPKDVAVKRLAIRNNLSEHDALKRIDSQMTNEQREKHADIVIRNDGDLTKFEQDIEREIAALLKRR
jgi:phosphopantetheine adenylyltransferase/dephospho-CoA kinase